MKTDIVIVTFNRRQLLQETLNKIWERTRTPYRIIVVDNHSVEDDTVEYLKEAYRQKRIDVMLLSEKNLGIAGAFNLAFEHVKSDIFITTNDDLTPPELSPCWLEQMLELFKKWYPEYGAIGMRHVRMRNVRFGAEWLPHYPNNELGESKLCMPAVFRLQKKSDISHLKHPFGDREWWDDQEFKRIMKELGFRSGFAKNIWAHHISYGLPNKGYGDLTSYLHYNEARNKRDQQKGMAPLDPKTNEPLTEHF